MPAQRLILVKHAPPVIEPGTPPSQWELSDEGRRKAADLGARLRHHLPAELVSSREPKAVQTAEAMARCLGITPRAGDDLFEHDRDTVPHMRSGEFISLVELFFRKPSELVLGDETADEATDRFGAAVAREIEACNEPTLIVVSHGTVIALLLARKTGQKPFPLFRQLGLPSFVVLDLPTWTVDAIVERV